MHPEPLPSASSAPLADGDLASFGARALAYLLDGLFVATISGVCITFLFTCMMVVMGSVDVPDGTVWVWVLFLGIFAITTTVWVVWNWLWVRSIHMAKPGQRIAGFRVLDAQELTPLSSGHAALRSFVQTGGVATGLIVVSAVTIAVTGRRQALHDLLAGTVCVRSSVVVARGISRIPMLPETQPVRAVEHEPTRGPFL